MGCLKISHNYFAELKIVSEKKAVRSEKTFKKGRSYLEARYYNPRISNWLSVDPMMVEDEAFDDPESTNGGVYNSDNNSVYSINYNNPVKYADPDGQCPNCVAAAAGAFVGGLIGGGVEAGMQYYNTGKVSNWKAVGGAATQGAIVGGVAGLTGGASLAAQAGAGAGANVVGGAVNRGIQGQKTTAGDVAWDFGFGAVFGAGAKGVSQVANFTLAKSFYKSAGFAAKDAASHMKGINFNKAVKETIVKKGTVIQQWVNNKTGKIGDYFTTAENGASKNLGLDDYGQRTLKSFTVTKDTKVLQSTASNMNGTQGGGTQYFSKELNKNVTAN
jgi:hypothetical protein